MKIIINVNEFTVFHLLIMATLGRKPYILGIDPVIPATRSGLQLISNWIVKIGRANCIIDLCPELKNEWDYPTRVNFYDIYSEIEDWQDRHYRFSEVESLVSNYARAYKIIVCKHVSNKRLSVLLIKKAVTKNSVLIYGLASDAVEMLEVYCSKSFVPFIKAMRAPWILVNFMITIIFQVAAISWVLSRTRFKTPQKHKFFFAADYLEDIRDVNIYQNMLDGGPVLLVRRFPEADTNKFEGLESFAACNQKDGLFGLLETFETIGFILRDSFQLFCHFYKLSSSLYYHIGALPFRRAVLRGFFNRYRPKYFWGRDDYNVEHTLRRDELNRVGGKSFGINHGTIVECLILGEFRYINFDHYYVFGRGIYCPEMQKRWDKDMKVIPVGSFGATREDYKLRFAPRPPNILFCVGFFVVLEECIKLVRAVAEEFSERRILLQLKPFFVHTKSGQEFVAACKKDISNIEFIDLPPSQLFSQVQYLFSDPSSTVQEAIQFGLKSFCIDLLPHQKTGIFREFPDLCVFSSEQAIYRIKSIEEGKWHYPLDKYSDLVDLSGKVFIDKVREDVGLLAKESAIPLIQKNVI
ncbi:MAG: hypothetical protein VX923_01065 [Pseudomonadota bacterium]|nr:hypothetical protein [Pseudomonadota bacterium]